MVFIGRIVERDAPPDEMSEGARSGGGGASGSAGRLRRVARLGRRRLAMGTAVPFIERLVGVALPRAVAAPVGALAVAVAAPAPRTPATPARAAAPEDGPQ